jgi:hypothetical protein
VTGIFTLPKVEWTGGAVATSERSECIALTDLVRRVFDNIYESKINNYDIKN